MKKAAITAPNKPLAVTSCPLPPVPDQGFLIKILASGICHTDLHLIEDEVALGDGKFWRHRDVLGDDYVGIVPGHELCGEVIQKGNKVPSQCDVKVGDKVMVFPWRGCRNCEMCYSGKSNWCERNKSTCTDVGKGMDGLKHGGYQSHFPLPEWQHAVKLPDNISVDIGCMLPCSGLTTYSAIEKAKESLEFAISTRGKGNLLIIGTGGLGIWTVINTRAIFGDKVHIYCADLNPDKLKLAKEYGADDTIQFSRGASADELVAMVTQNGDRKMDSAIDIVGNPVTQKIGFFSLHNGGTLVPLGFAGGQLALPIPNIIGKSISIRGNRVGDIKQLKDLTEIYSKAGFKKTPPVEYFPIENVNDALDKLRQGKIEGRAILQFD